MALAIASGVPLQYGLYTAFIAGFVIALTGGSRFSISGPTTAFVVIVYPIAQADGLGGLLLASLMSGALLIVMAFMRLGRFIEYIPESVTLGFTAAIARSAANYRAGAESPISAMVHALVVLLAPLLAYLPMAAMAALLIMVAWNMSEAPKSLHLLKTAPRSDILVFVTCFSLTVLLDMVIAITTGILLAAVLFMREMAQTTRVTDITGSKRLAGARLPDGWRVFKINGLLFFAAADRIFGELAQLSASARGLILYMDGVTILDAGGLSAMNKLINTCRADGTQVVIADLQFQPLRTLARAGVKPEEGMVRFYPTLDEAINAESRLAIT